MTPKEKKIVDQVSEAAIVPMDKMLKKQQKLTQEMLKYSFDLGRRLGYIHGWGDKEKGSDMHPECTPAALIEFLNRDLQ